MELKYNLMYWSNEEYFGFGVGVYGYISGIWIVNVGFVKYYIDLIVEKGFLYRDIYEVIIEE